MGPSLVRLEKVTIVVSVWDRSNFIPVHSYAKYTNGHLLKILDMFHLITCALYGTARFFSSLAYMTMTKTLAASGI